MIMDGRRWFFTVLYLYDFKKVKVGSFWLKRDGEDVGILIKLVTREMLNVTVFPRKCYVPESWLLIGEIMLYITGFTLV
jgi:hypothetical protein